MAFNLNDYDPVEKRLGSPKLCTTFWEDYPDGRVETELVSVNAEGFIVKAWLYRTFLDSVPFSSGLAHEKVSDRGVNSTSALENCETSAIGRALANAGYAAKGKRPSREEMEKVARYENDKKLETITVAPEDSWDTFTATMPETVKASASNVIDFVKEALNAEEVPQCVHGNRIKKQGTAKTGKPYLGWVCAETGSRGALQTPKCEPIWYKYVEQTGTFRAPEEFGE